MKYLAYIILAVSIIFNLWLNFPETKILGDPNDNVFQYTLVDHTNLIWENYNCPFSLNCFPNLIDHLVPNWAEGYPLPFYYSHLPQIAIVASYQMIIKPISQLFSFSFSLYEYYNWTKYLLLCFFPLTVFLALRLVGFSSLSSALAAFFAANYSTDGLYGIDPPSFLWRGYGLTSQLYAMFFMPLGLAFTYRAVKEVSRKNNRSDLVSKIGSLRNLKLFGVWDLGFGISNSFWAVVFLTLTTAGHLGLGIIGLISTTPFLLLDLNKSNIVKRGKKLFLIYISLMIALSYWIIPILLHNNYHIISFWDPIWKFDSYGWYEVTRQFFAGEIFDWQRMPVITALVLIGFFTLLTNPNLFAFALIFAMMMLLYFGRTTWGGLIDLIPGMKDFHLHRFIVGVHIASLFLLPAGIQYLLELIKKITDKVILLVSVLKNTPRRQHNESLSAKDAQFAKPFFVVFLIIIFSSLIYFTVKQTVTYAQLNNRWIGEANNAYVHDEKNFLNLKKDLELQPKARIYAGRPGNWGKQFRLGSTQLYMLLTVNGFDISQFLPETWSPLSENDQNFDERVAEDYDLLNIRYIVAPENKDFTEKALLTEKYGPFEFYKVPTTGWFDVVSSPMFVRTDKTNYINLVHLWHRTYPRRWKMHPLISVEKKPNIPPQMQRNIKMVNEVTYDENGVKKNIFADFPFVFPEATVSGRIVKENVSKQTYSAEIDVPSNCTSCFYMFKMSYHPNWQVKVDGQPVEKFAVFPFYLAAKAEPGTHTVEFTHQPNRFKMVLLLLEVVILLILLFRKKIIAFFHR